MNRLALLASCLVVLVACNKKGDAAKPAEAPAAGKPGAAPAAGAKPVGLADPANLPAVVELAKKALGCKFENGAFDSSCPEYKAWDDEKKLFDDAAELTLVAFLEDADQKVRLLGEKKLSDVLGFIDDKAEAERVLAVAEKSKEPGELADLGNLAGRVKLEAVDVLPRLTALLNAKQTHPNLRVGIIGSLMRTNPANDDVFALMRQSVNNADFDENVQRQALGVLSSSTKAEKCDVFLENIGNAKADFSGDALQWLTQPRMKCEAHYDKALAKIDERIKAKTATSTFFPIALEQMCPPKGLGKAPLAKKAAALAKKLAEDKALDGGLRASALSAAFTCDPKGGKAYLGKFKKEADPQVKETVARLSKPAKKKK